MRDRELYARILGTEAPWRVEGVELKLEEGEVVVQVEHVGGGCDVRSVSVVGAGRTRSSDGGAGGGGSLSGVR